MMPGGTRCDLQPMYRRLPHGPSGMAREEVQRNQRSRLYGAMIEAVARKGYQPTTVADVIALAGVSRRAFYELFPNKQECFLGTCDVIVAQARRQLVHGWLSEHGWANRMHSSCQCLLSAVAAAPKGPRLVLVDALGIGPRARERMQLAGLVFERIVASAFSLAPADVRYPPLTSRVVVGGVRHILFNRLLERRHRELAELGDEVLDWIESYRMPAGTRLRALGLARPENAAQVPAALLAGEDRRARALAAVVRLTLDGGYAELTDPQIARLAGVSTEVFHRQFAGKEECFLAALDEFAAETLERVRPAMEGADSWEQAVCLTTDAYLAHLAAHRALLRIAFIDSFEVGPAMIGRMTRSLEHFTAMLTEPGPAPMRAPLIAREAVAGALWGVIATFVSDERLARLPSLADHLAFTVLAPYVGARAGIQALADRHRRQAAA